jgi:hypothetical protein
MTLLKRKGTVQGPRIQTLTSDQRFSCDPKSSPAYHSTGTVSHLLDTSFDAAEERVLQVVPITWDRSTKEQTLPPRNCAWML